MSLVNWSKWKRSFAKRHDRVVRRLGLTHLSLLDHEFESSIRRWRNDGAEERLRYEYDLCDEDVVFDLGGFRGSWTAEISARYNCHVHVFEPVPAYHRTISCRFARNQRIHVHAFGLSDSTCQVKLGVEGDASGKWKKSPEVVDAQLRDVVGFLDEANVRQIALCKINIEGTEYDLLERLLDADAIHRFSNLQIQFHNFVPRARERRAAIQSRLQSTHSLTYEYPFVWENWRLRRESAAAAA